MIPSSRFSAHRSAIFTAGAVAVVVAVVAGVAIASGGYAAQRVDLGDAAVWVASDRVQAVGRANTAVLELNSVVVTGGRGAEIVQDGSTVLVLDRDRASVGLVDATTSALTETIAMPPDEPSLALAGSRVVVASDGKVWTVPVAEFAEFDSGSEPMLTFGAGAVTSVDAAGTLFAYTPSTGDVARVDAAGAETVESRWQLDPLHGDPEVQITSVAGRWAVFDVDGRILHLQSGRVDLSGVLRPGQAPVLQEPSVTGDEVAIAHRMGLIAVGLDGELRTLVDRRSGEPAAPVVHDGCLHAAWALGSAWRSCAAPDARLIDRDGATGAGDLAFLANGHALVLNDRRSGQTWAASGEYQLIDNWDQLLDIERDEETVEQNDPNEPPTIEKSQVPPVAVDDAFGARPGRSTLLPVLLNDYDANGDVLVVDSIDGELPPGAKLDRVSDNQQLQLTLDDAASGSITFGYVAGDGRGGTAHATVHVEVREPDENAPPAQQRPTRASVESGGRVSTAVLGDWVDPDGDPFFLRQAVTQDPDSLSSTADGVVVFDEFGGRGSERAVSLVVSDGRDESVGSLEIAVAAPGDVPLIADPFVALATAGEEIRIDPLRHVRGGSGEVRLTAVPAKPDAVLVPDFDGGSFRFTSSVVRTHLLEYTVTDGTKTATGVVRVDVSAPPDREITPITVPHTAFLRTQQPVDVDVLATDIDPTGGVLVVTGLIGDDSAEGARIEVIDHRVLRVTLTRPLETGSTTFGYRVSNGLAEAEGEVTLVEVPEPEIAQPPVATPDTISARTGDVVDIAVLANDEHPDALPLTLSPELVEVPEAGLLFAAGDRLRYYAPDTAGEFDASYRVDGPDGQYANANVHISVRDADPETNTPPVPSTITARVIAGETVRIPIPLGGADPDGDSVQLIGQESNPERGSVTARGADWLEYQAGEYSAGTDSFQYAVVDALGSHATGSVRVGIAPRADGARRPIAVEDLVTVRPGRTVSVRVLANDSDPDGGALRLVGVEPTVDGATAVIVDENHLEVTIPDEEGEYGFRYAIENDRLGTAETFLRVEARDDAPLARPEASDTVLGLSDILDVERIDVPVLRNVFLADGAANDLVVELVPGYEGGAEVRRDGAIRVDVEDRRRIIPFLVRHPEDPSITAHAFIWVPGRDDALPQLRSDAPRVRVISGQEVRLDLDEYVIAASGRPVRLTDTASVSASHDDGTPLAVDEDTLRYRSEPGYFGPASLSFTVTDGESAADPEGRTGTIVVPITVLPTENQPPVFTGGVIDFEPGQTKTIDLLKLTTYPYPESLDELVFEVLAPAAVGFRVSLDGHELTVEAEESTAKGSRAAIAIGVADEEGKGRAGRIDVRVVPSTRPLAQPAADTAIAPRGRTTTIDVLANDRATNPFPGTALRVVGVRGIDADSLPSGVSIEPSADRSTLAVTVGDRAAPVNTTVQYQVADATDDPSRYAWGSVTISVQDRPDPVTGATVTGFGDGTLDVAFGAGGFNNSPIVGYEISLLDPSSRDVVATSECVATTCTVPTPGNGQGNAVIVRVQARNGVGLSDPVEAPGPVWSDVIPPAPGGLRAAPLDGRLRIEWAPVSTGSGSAVGSYVVSVAGVSREVPASTACTSTTCSADSQPLDNGSQVPFTVSARNQAYPALATWTEAGGTGTPFGSPIAGGITVNGDAAAGTVTVSWSPFSGNGDAIGGYFVQRLIEGETGVPSGPQSCSVTSPAPGTVIAPSSGGTVAEVVQVGPDASSVQFAGTATESARYSFLVWGFNRAGCVNTEVVGTVVRPAPGSVDVRSKMNWMDVETWDRYIDGVDGSAWRYQIVAVDAGGAQIPGSQREFRGSGWLRSLLNRPFGETARFQVRGCSIWGSCGPWSQTLPSETSPSLTFALPSRTWTEAPVGTWAWTAAPENSGLPVTFRCGIEGDREGRLAQTATSCAIPEAKKGDRVWLDVEVAGVIARYENR